jgi:hypothetical protein
MRIFEETSGPYILRDLEVKSTSSMVTLDMIKLNTLGYSFSKRLITPWSDPLLEGGDFLSQSKNPPNFHETTRFITVFTRAHPIPYPVPEKSSPHLLNRVLIYLPSGFQTKYLICELHC